MYVWAYALHVCIYSLPRAHSHARIHVRVCSNDLAHVGTPVFSIELNAIDCCFIMFDFWFTLSLFHV